MLSLELNGCQCQTRKSSKGRHFILYRQDGLPLYNTESGLELLVPQEHQGPWMEIFDSLTGMKKSDSVENILGPPDLPPRPSATYRQNSLTHDKSKVLSDMIKSYMKITHKTLLDITPKYIIMSLVQATLSYIKRDLLGDLMEAYESESDKKTLLEPSDLEKVQRQTLLETLNATRDAVDAVTTIAC